MTSYFLTFRLKRHVFEKIYNHRMFVKACIFIIVCILCHFFRQILSVFRNASTVIMRDACALKFEHIAKTSVNGAHSPGCSRESPPFRACPCPVGFRPCLFPRWFCHSSGFVVGVYLAALEMGCRSRDAFG